MSSSLRNVLHVSTSVTSPSPTKPASATLLLSEQTGKHFWTFN